MKFKYQYGCIVITAICFFDYGLVVFYGGLISILNVVLLERHIKKQKLKLTLNASASFRLILKSIIIRTSLLILLIIIGFWIGLDPKLLIFGLAAGQIGFLLDKFLG